MTTSPQFGQQLAPPSNALALVGLVMGIIAWVIAIFAPNVAMALFLSAVPALLAIIFGFIGITTANRLAGKRRTIAIWAVVLGFTTILAYPLSGFLLAAIFGVTR